KSSSLYSMGFASNIYDLADQSGNRTIERNIKFEVADSNTVDHFKLDLFAAKAYFGFPNNYFSAGGATDTLSATNGVVVASMALISPGMVGVDGNGLLTWN